MVKRWLFLFCLFIWIPSNPLLAQSNDIDVSETKNVEVILGQDHVEYLDFAPHTKLQIARPEILDVIMVPAKREVLFESRHDLIEVAWRNRRVRQRIRRLA